MPLGRKCEEIKQRKVFLWLWFLRFEALWKTKRILDLRYFEGEEIFCPSFLFIYLVFEMVSPCVARLIGNS
jgi:hypothetical protein